MALLDVVTDTMFDPDIIDPFDVIRRAQTTTAHGRTQITSTTIPGLTGVITASSPSELDRSQDYQTMTRSITVVTQFALRGASEGFQPDIVVWKGTRHIVKHVGPYPHFGPGFYQAECSSEQTIDPPI